jgi:peptide/nickel transport system substrate-binding protein
MIDRCLSALATGYLTVVNGPMSGVFNNLVMFKQDVPQNSLRSIVPDLATSWSSNEEGTELTFPLRQGVKWHDGKPFTAANVKCTFDLLMDKTQEKLRINPRKSWYANVAAVTTNGDHEATFHLKRPQPSFLALLARVSRSSEPWHCSFRLRRSGPVSGAVGRP